VEARRCGEPCGGILIVDSAGKTIDHFRNERQALDEVAAINSLLRPELAAAMERLKKQWESENDPMGWAELVMEAVKSVLDAAKGEK
jgi:hypothetical protein